MLKCLLIAKESQKIEVGLVKKKFGLNTEFILRKSVLLNNLKIQRKLSEY